jgi:lysophospholipase
MVEDIEENYEKYDAFIIMHGTDTMAYTASALSFMLENLSKSVILTGSQVPFAQEPNDAAHNLLMSLTIAGHFEIPEVCIYFDHKLFRGNRSRKVSALGFDAFNSLNHPALVKVGTEMKVNWSVIRPPPPREETSVFHKVLSSNVGVLKIFPGVSDATIKNFLLEPLEGCVLETYGTGNAPSNRPEFLKILQDATARGVVIINVTQCHKGMVSHGTYATSSSLAAVGVLSGYDMTTEAALAKLSYLLTHPGLSHSRIKELVGTSIRGELSSDDVVKFSFHDESFLKSVAMALHSNPTKKSLPASSIPLVSLRHSTSINTTTSSSSTIMYGVTTPIVSHAPPFASTPVPLLSQLQHSSSSTSAIMEHHHKYNNKDQISPPSSSSSSSSQQGEDDLKNALFPVLLCAAAQMGSVDSLRALIETGANANCMYDGRSPLHVAAREGHLRATQFLVECCHAKIDMLDRWNCTPLDDALSLAHTSVVEYLKSVNAIESDSSTKLTKEPSRKQGMSRHPLQPL